MHPSDFLPSYEEAIKRNLATEDYNTLRTNQEKYSTESRSNIFEPTDVTRTQTNNLNSFACIGPKYSICGNCKQFVKNKIINKNNVGTYVSDKILFFIGYFLCNCIPYFKYDLISSSKNKYVYCPNCNIYLGIPNDGILTNRSF